MSDAVWTVVIDDEGVHQNIGPFRDQDEALDWINDQFGDPYPEEAKALFQHLPADAIRPA